MSEHREDCVCDPCCKARMRQWANTPSEFDTLRAEFDRDRTALEDIRGIIENRDKRGMDSGDCLLQIMMCLERVLPSTSLCSLPDHKL